MSIDVNKDSKSKIIIVGDTVRTVDGEEVYDLYDKQNTTSRESSEFDDMKDEVSTEAENATNEVQESEVRP